jgi:hypothetical protein
MAGKAAPYKKVIKAKKAAQVLKKKELLRRRV